MTTASRFAYPLMTGLLAACLAGEAGAQAPAPIASSDGGARQPSRLTAYFHGKEQIGELYAVGRQWDKKLGLQQDCKGPYNIQPASLFLLKPIDFPEGKLHPTAGAWQHRYVFERCGKRMTYNAVFVARPDDKPETRPHVPGNTNASALLIADTLKGAYSAALLRLSKRAKDCKQAEFIDTKLIHPPSTAREGDKPAGHWEETWTFRGCGHDIELPITFNPDGKGGTYYVIKGAS
jgi:hypothetical protein